MPNEFLFDLVDTIAHTLRRAAIPATEMAATLGPVDADTASAVYAVPTDSRLTRAIVSREAAGGLASDVQCLVRPGASAAPVVFPDRWGPPRRIPTVDDPAGVPYVFGPFANDHDQFGGLIRVRLDGEDGPVTLVGVTRYPR